MNFLNRCAVRANAGGNDDFVLENAIPGFYTPPLCLNPSVVDGSEYNYFAISDDGTQHEEGSGTWEAASSQLFRTTIRNSSNSGSLVTFSAAPIVYMGGPTAEDMLTIYEDHATEQFGFGVSDASELQPGRITVKPTPAGLGDNLTVNGDFAGNADNWTLQTGWAYDTNKVTHTPGTGIGSSIIQSDLPMATSEVFQVGFTLSGFSGTPGNALSVSVGDGPFVSVNITGDGAYEVEAVCGDFIGFLVIQVDLDDFGGSLTDVTLNKKLTSANQTQLHEDGSPALIVETAAGSVSPPAKLKVDIDNNLTLVTTTLAYERPSDNVKATHKTAALTQDREYNLPDIGGAVQVQKVGGMSVTELFSFDPYDTQIFAATVNDATLDIATGIGTVVAGGGSNYVPVYFDENTQEWKIG